MSNPYIAHVVIKNFRNFEELNIGTDEKQLIIGENAVGKSNYIRALQLILDPSLSEQDRILSDEDFPNTHDKPMKNGEKIKISIFISEYENSPALMCILGDAIVKIKEANYAKITYSFQPVDDDDLTKGYFYNIYKGNNEANKFDSFCRKYLNIKVINALRDVESELLSSRKSPLKKLIDKHKINLSDESYSEMIEGIRTQNKKLLDIDEVADVRSSLKNRIDDILIRYNNSSIDIGLVEENPNKLLTLLSIFENSHNLSQTSLGICNVIYIQLILEQLQNEIPSLISLSLYEKMDEDQKELIDNYYNKSERNNCIKNDAPITSEDCVKLIEILSLVDESRNCLTILVIEEPEAHLHPSFQRMLYRDIFVNAKTPIILTSHSPHVASICPINYIIQLRRDANNFTIGTSAKNVDLSLREKKNLQRYIDVNRGDIYFGKGVILVEGISEEILVPVFAARLGVDLDAKGIIVCNVNSTNFFPYLRLLEQLKIPKVLITDGDPSCDETGLKRIKDTCKKLYKEEIINKLKTTKDWNVFLINKGYFIGESTLEIDIMEAFSLTSNCSEIIDSFNNATTGGDIHKENFKIKLTSGDFIGCLSMIERKEVGKGRFSQELANSVFIKESIPDYIKSAITKICERV